MTCTSSGCTQCYTNFRLNGAVCGEWEKSVLPPWKAPAHPHPRNTHVHCSGVLLWIPAAVRNTAAKCAHHGGSARIMVDVAIHPLTPASNPCAEACPASTFSAGGSATSCTKCAAGCTACTSSTSCDRCDTNYRMNNGVCGECDATSFTHGSCRRRSISPPHVVGQAWPRCSAAATHGKKQQPCSSFKAARPTNQLPALYHRSQRLAPSAPTAVVALSPLAPPAPPTALYAMPLAAVSAVPASASTPLPRRAVSVVVLAHH